MGDFLLNFLMGIVELLPYAALGWFIVELVLLVQRKRYMKGHRKNGKPGFKSKNRIRFIASALSIVVTVIIHNLFYMLVENRF